MKSTFTGEDLFQAFNSVHVDWKKVVWIWDIFATVMQIEKNGNNFNMCIVVSLWELGIGSKTWKFKPFPDSQLRKFEWLEYDQMRIKAKLEGGLLFSS